MKTWREAVIAECANMLGSSEWQTRCEAANVPHTHPTFNENQSLQKAAQSLYFEIREMRQAEHDFFASHPELNP